MTAAEDVGRGRPDGFYKRGTREVEEAGVVEIGGIAAEVLVGVVFAAAEHQDLVGGRRAAWMARISELLVTISQGIGSSFGLLVQPDKWQKTLVATE